jgi:hypothetical protein
MELNTLGIWYIIDYVCYMHVITVLIQWVKNMFYRRRKKCFQHWGQWSVVIFAKLLDAFFYKCLYSCQPQNHYLLQCLKLQHRDSAVEYVDWCSCAAPGNAGLLVHVEPHDSTQQFCGIQLLVFNLFCAYNKYFIGSAFPSQKWWWIARTRNEHYIFNDIDKIFCWHLNLSVEKVSE